jgi:transposase
MRSAHSHAEIMRSHLTDTQWALVGPHIPSAKFGGRPRTTDVRAVRDAIIYLLRTGCQWRQLPSDFPPWPTVHGYFRGWRMSGVWALLHRALYPRARLAAGRKPGPTGVIMDGQSVKTAEQGGVGGFDGHKRVKGRPTAWGLTRGRRKSLLQPVRREGTPSTRSPMGRPWADDLACRIG